MVSSMSALESNFYPTLAQVLPVLLLALIWDSAYLVRLRHQQRLPRHSDPAGVWFWTKPRVRAYTLLVTGETITSIAITMLVLAGLIPDTFVLRLAMTAGLLLLLATLAVRITVDIIRATADSPPPAAPDQTAPNPGEGSPGAGSPGSGCPAGQDRPPGGTRAA